MGDVATRGFKSVIARKNASSGPVDEATLTAWFKADGDVYNSGTTQATNGQTVYKWLDATGNGYDLNQTTTASKPLFVTSKQNGLPGVQFQGTNDWMDVGATVLSAAPMSVYVVAETTDVTTSSAVLSFAWNGGGDDWFVLFVDGTDTGDPLDWNVRRGSQGIATTSTGVTTATAFLGTAIEVSSTDRTAYIAGGSAGTNTLNTAPSSVNDFGLGRIVDLTPSSYFTGHIYEVRVHNVAHGTTTRNEVEAELNSKWAL